MQSLQQKNTSSSHIQPENWSIKSLIEVEFDDPDDFLKIKEALTRIGVCKRNEKKLFQSCHILHKQGHYFITHFKELHLIDGYPADLSESDVQRRNRIASLLEEWGMVRIKNKDAVKDKISMRDVKVISRKDLSEGWQLIPKYIFAAERHKRKK